MVEMSDLMHSSFHAAMSASTKKNGRKTKLSNDFTPGKYAVLCGRGSKCTKSPGNQRLKQLVHSYLKPYSEAKNKVEKTSIVSAIINSVKQHSGEGAFVKYEEGSWWEVEDAFAREKIGCLFRDCLHTQYRSSTKAKLARKKAKTDHPMMPGDQQSMGLSATPMHTSLHSMDSFGMNSNNNNMMADFSFQQQRHLQQPHQSPQPQPQQSMSSFMPMPDKMQGFKKQEYASLLGNYLGPQNSRPVRDDFMSACNMPLPNTLDMNMQQGFQANNHNNNGFNPQSMGMGGALSRSSLLQTAVDILGDDNNLAVEDDEDFPDDLSDIFEEETNNRSGYNVHSSMHSTFAL